MPLDALSAKARLMVPVGAIDSRCELRMPCLRIASLIAVRQARGEVAARKIEVLVEHRERAALLRELDRCAVGAVAHELGDLRGRRARRIRVVAQAQHRERIAQAGEAQADAALGHRLLVLLLQRPGRHVEHVVEHAHRRIDHFSERIEIERSALVERIAHEAREVDRSQAAAAVGGQRLLGAGVGRSRSSRSSRGCCRGSCGRGTGCPARRGRRSSA